MNEGCRFLVRSKHTSLTTFCHIERVAWWYCVLVVMCDKQDQLDEVEFLQAMSKDEEFEWEEGPDTGTISGTFNVAVQLDCPLSMRLVRKEKVQVKEKSEDEEATPPKLLAQHSNRDHTAQVEHLPPFMLHFQLPSTYPSTMMPEYTLTCRWLNFSQLSQLCQSLDQVWKDVGGVVLYNWQQLLATETLSILNIDPSGMCLEYEDPRVPKPEWDPRAVQDINNPFMVLPSLIEYDEMQKLSIFNESFFDCEVCYVAKQGTKCVKVSSCQHVFCRECLSSYLKTKIKDGDVTKIECPTCSTGIQPFLVKELLPVEDYNRFDKLLLQRTLEGMMDVVYCPIPSCGCATVREPDSNMGQCPRCSFCFCILCRHTWHGLAPCKLLPGDLKELHGLWDTLDEAEKKHLAEQYGGRKKLELAFQEYESLQWVGKNAKRCPKCASNIEKTEGCNKMTCTQCLNNFCWLCDAPLPKHDPYSHFRMVINNKSACAGQLFTGMMTFNEDDI